MSEDASAGGATSSGAARLVETALLTQRESHHEQLGVVHWLVALLQLHAPMAQDLSPGLEAKPLLLELQARLQQADCGAALAVDAVVQQATERAHERKKQQASERDLAAVILAAAGYQVKTDPALPPPPLLREGMAGAADAAPAGQTEVGRSRRPTPTLDQFGRDLTAAARAGKLTRIIGREEQIQTTIEVLCRPQKRNPLLTGPAGVGKTAIVEGLAQRIVRGEVPAFPPDWRIVALQPSCLVAGASMVGELEKRMRAVLAEASQDGLLLFIDEVHSMVGAGGHQGLSDVASLLKPSLARDDLRCIAATTDEEWTRWIEPDDALERRFQPIHVPQLKPEETREVLAVLRDDLGTSRGLEVSDQVLWWLLDFAEQFLHNRYFPDKAVDLLFQCLGYAVANGRQSVTLADAKIVAERMVGMPLELATRQEALSQALTARSLMAPDDIQALLHRLAVTLRRLDIRPARPNAVLLLIDEMAGRGLPVAEAIAEGLFGSPDRVVTIDFGRFTESHDITLLLGPPPGYIGYGEALELHKVAQSPWCVLRCENLHSCHPYIRDVLEQGIAEGFLTDSTGKKVYLSDAVVLLTAEVAAHKTHKIGFQQGGEKASLSARAVAEQALTPRLVRLCDVVCAQAPRAEETGREWLESHILPEWSGRYVAKGLEVHWDEALVNWLLAQHDLSAGKQDWEHLIDDRLSALLVPYVDEAESGQVKILCVTCQGEPAVRETPESVKGD